MYKYTIHIQKSKTIIVIPNIIMYFFTFHYAYDVLLYGEEEIGERLLL